MKRLWANMKKNESIDAWDYFINGVMQKAAEKNGYKENPDVYVWIGYDCHAEFLTPPHTCYAYIPIVKNDECYFTKINRCDREQDYKTAWRFFEDKYGG